MDSKLSQQSQTDIGGIINNNNNNNSNNQIIKDIENNNNNSFIKNKQNQNLLIYSMDIKISDFNFIFSTKLLDTEFTDEIILPLNKSKESDQIFTVKFTKDNLTTDLQINLMSQAFRYSHNFIENISTFFNIAEFEQISDLINQKTSNLLNIDLDNLQKLYFFDRDFKAKKIEIFNFSVKINHQIFIIPFTKGINSDFNDAFIFDIGEMNLNNFNNLGIFNSMNFNFNSVNSYSYSKINNNNNNNNVNSVNFNFNESEISGTNEDNVNSNFNNTQAKEFDCLFNNNNNNTKNQSKKI